MKTTIITKLVMTIAIAPQLIQASGAVFLQVGQMSNRFGRSPSANSIIVGGGASYLYLGTTGKDYGAAISLYGDIMHAISGSVRTADVGGGVDAMLRIKFLAFGPNIDVRQLIRELPNEKNPNLQPASIFAAGAGGSARITFGPQGRAFAQVRYTDYGRLGNASLQGSLFGFATASVKGTAVPNRNGRRWAASIGYQFPKRFFLRGQITNYNIAFEQVANVNQFGQQDHRSTAYTMGIGWTF